MKMYLWLLVPVAALAAAVVTAMAPPDPAERKLCDQAVDALLHSKDLVEVQRAGIVIREVSCGIGRRLRENGK